MISVEEKPRRSRLTPDQRVPVDLEAVNGRKFHEAVRPVKGEVSLRGFQSHRLEAVFRGDVGEVFAKKLLFTGAQVGSRNGGADCKIAFIGFLECCDWSQGKAAMTRGDQAKELQRNR